jgi:hypothetical protein
MFNIRVAPVILLLSLVGGLQAQQTPVTTVPRLVRVTDLHPAPLWQETQNVTLASEPKSTPKSTRSEAFGPM